MQGKIRNGCSLGMRIVACCLLFFAAAWDASVSISALSNFPALFCKRLQHTAATQMACCPLQAARPSTGKCCEPPAPAPDSVPTAKNNGVCNATCCMSVVALPAPARIDSATVHLQTAFFHKRNVFDLKMDLRI